MIVYNKLLITENNMNPPEQNIEYIKINETQ